MKIFTKTHGKTRKICENGKLWYKLMLNIIIHQKSMKKAKKKIPPGMGLEPMTEGFIKSRLSYTWDHTNTYKEMSLPKVFTLVPAEEVTNRFDFLPRSSPTWYAYFKPKTASKYVNLEEEKHQHQTDRQTDRQTDGQSADNSVFSC